MRHATTAATALLGGLVLLALPGCERRPPAPTGEILTTRTLGLAFLEENHLDEAEAQFRRLTELAPDEPLGFADLGLVYLRQAQYAKADGSIRHALRLAPTDPDVRLMLAKVLELSDSVPAARRVLEGTLKHTPTHVKSLYALAQLSANSRNREAGARRVQYLDRLVTLAPANVPARLQLIEALLTNDRADSALAQLEQLHAQVPELSPQAAAYFEQAVEQLRAGRAADALRPMLVLTNFLRATGLYQVGVQALEGPGGILVGFPIVTFSQPLAGQQSTEAVLAALKFTDVTRAACCCTTITACSPTSPARPEPARPAAWPPLSATTTMTATPTCSWRGAGRTSCSTTRATGHSAT